MNPDGTAADGIRIVLVTFGDVAVAREAVRMLVGERLAACGTLLAGAASIYHWKGAIEESTECQVLLKTTADSLPRLETRLHDLHSYEVPEFIVLRAEASTRYAGWIERTVQEIPPSAAQRSPGSG